MHDPRKWGRLKFSNDPPPLGASAFETGTPQAFVLTNHAKAYLSLRGSVAVYCCQAGIVVGGAQQTVVGHGWGLDNCNSPGNGELQ